MVKAHLGYCPEEAWHFICAALSVSLWRDNTSGGSGQPSPTYCRFRPAILRASVTGTIARHGERPRTREWDAIV